MIIKIFPESEKILTYETVEDGELNTQGLFINQYHM